MQEQITKLLLLCSWAHHYPPIGFRDSLDDKSKASLVQIKGRFSVTSENLDLVKDIPLSTVPRRASQGSPLRKSASVGDWMNDSKQVPMPKEVCNSNLPSCQPITKSNLTASHLMPHLQNIFQQNSVQQDLILTLLNSLQPADGVDAAQNGKLPLLSLSSESNGSVDGAIPERERLLLIKVAELQARLSCLTEELKAEKLKYAQLQQQVKSVSGQENGVEMEVDT
uniref:Uncharacterized protein MANES_02G003400 n=1 Tax=Rhizophora mucronata TaxID=61149 RepID=A0A2P2LGD0_RHIMU